MCEANSTKHIRARFQLIHFSEIDRCLESSRAHRDLLILNGAFRLKRWHQRVMFIFAVNSMTEVMILSIIIRPAIHGNAPPIGQILSTLVGTMVRFNQHLDERLYLPLYCKYYIEQKSLEAYFGFEKIRESFPIV
jgi:hypothetical protein